MTEEKTVVETIDLTFLGSGNHRTTHKNILNTGFEKLENKFKQFELELNALKEKQSNVQSNFQHQHEEISRKHLEEESKHLQSLEKLKLIREKKLAKNPKNFQRGKIIHDYNVAKKRLVSKKELSDQVYSEQLRALQSEKELSEQEYSKQLSALKKKYPTNTAMRLFDGIGCQGTDKDPRPGTYQCDFENDQKTKITKPAANPSDSYLAYFGMQYTLKKFKVYAQKFGWSAWNSLKLAQEFLVNFSKNTEQQLYSSKETLGNVSALVSGAGMLALVDEADEYIAHIINKNDGSIPKTLNLKGYSRGADACIRLANRIYESYPQIEVNMFLLDPVPGPYHRKDDGSFIIPGNVKLLNVTYMLDESIPFFKPQHRGRLIIANPALTKVKDHYLRGGHSDAARLDANPKRLSKQTKQTFTELQKNFQEFLRNTTQEVILPVSFGLRTQGQHKQWTSPALFDIDVLSPKNKGPKENWPQIYFAKDETPESNKFYLYYRENPNDFSPNGTKKLSIHFDLEVLQDSNQYQITFNGQKFIIDSATDTKKLFQLSPAIHHELFQEMTSQLSDEELEIFQEMNSEHVSSAEEPNQTISTTLYTRTLAKEDHKALYQDSKIAIKNYFDNYSIGLKEPDNIGEIDISKDKNMAINLSKADFYKQQFRDAIHFYHYHEPCKTWTKTVTETIYDAYQRFKEILQGKTMEEKTKLYPNQYAFMKIKEALDFEAKLRKEEDTLPRGYVQTNIKISENRTLIAKNYEETFQLIHNSSQESFFKTHLKDFSAYQEKYLTDVLTIETSFAKAKEDNGLPIALDATDEAQVFWEDKEMRQLKTFYDAQERLPLLRKEIVESKTLNSEKQKALLQQIDAIGQANYVAQVLNPIKKRNWSLISLFSSQKKDEPPTPTSSSTLGPTV